MPNNSSALGRPDLALLLEDFDLAMDRLGFVGLKIFPRFDAGLVSANAMRMKLATLLENRNTARNSDGSYGKGDFVFEDWHYSCQENGLEMPIDKRKRAIFKKYFDIEVVATELCYDAILRNQEKRIVAAVLSATTFGTTCVVTSGAITTQGNTMQAGKSTSTNNLKWTSSEDATPIDDVLAAQEAVRNASGLWPDTLVLSRKLFKRLKQCQQIIDRIKYTKDPNTMSATDIAQAFDLKNVLVSGGAKNTADSGQTAAISELWDPTKVLVCKVAEKMSDPWDPGIGRTFYFTEDGGEVVETYYSDEKRGDVVRARHDTDEKMMYAEAGFVITSAA